jgi:predicted metal-dependent hydrolase
VKALTLEEARLRRGAALFNEAAFFEAHEIWEDAWREATGDRRRLLHGLIQIAAGFVKLQRGEPRGAWGLLGKGAGKLHVMPADAAGLDVHSLLLEVSAWRVAIATMLEEGQRAFDAAALPRLKFLRRAGSPRGKEPA